MAKNLKVPRVPFPLPFRIGTDIIDLRRVEAILAKGKAQAFATRILHKNEKEDLTKRYPDWASLDSDALVNTPAGKRIRDYLGGRWAAKEAARKAIGAHRLGQKEVWVEFEQRRGLTVVYPMENEAGEIVEQVGLCSISHENDYAVASVIALPLIPTSNPTTTENDDQSTSAVIKKLSIDHMLDGRSG